MPRRQHITLLTLIGGAAFLAICFVSIFRSQAQGTRHPDYIPSYQEEHVGLNLDEGILHGEATAPKLENATLKYISWTWNLVYADQFVEQSLAMLLGKCFIQWWLSFQTSQPQTTAKLWNPTSTSSPAYIHAGTARGISKRYCRSFPHKSHQGQQLRRGPAMCTMKLIKGWRRTFLTAPRLGTSMIVVVLKIQYQERRRLVSHN